MKKSISIGFVTILLLVSASYTPRQINAQDRAAYRSALVIGNSAYLDGPLGNPVNDARDMSKTLDALGFDVISKENLTQSDMKRAIRNFGEKLRKGGVGLFYYAGHGLQVKGINYLVPIDAEVNSEPEVEYECVDAGLVLAQMVSAHNGANIVILDACRDNPFARTFRSSSRGLAPMDAPTGTLISYATALGSVASDGLGRNGLYTQELLRFVNIPGQSLENVFKLVRTSVNNLTQGKQTPWEYSSFIGDFYFKSASKVDPNSGPPTKFEVDHLGDPEPGKRYWANADEFSWVERYPSGASIVQKIIGRATIDGDIGTIVEPGKHNQFQVFIPDRGSNLMWVRFRHYVDGTWQAWRFLGEMRLVK